jgi:hypothetical protein
VKKTIKIIFAVFMSVLIICFSCVSVFADTSVDTETINLAYFQKLIKDNNFSLDCSLAELPVDDYLVVAEYNTYYTDDYLYFNFIPRSGKKYAYVEDIVNTANDLKKVVTVDNDTIYLCKNSQGRLYLYFSFDYYTLRLSNISVLKHYSVSDAMYGMFGFYMYFGSDIKYTDNYFVNEKSLFDKISEVTTVYPLLNITDKATLDYCSSLFAYCTQLVPGYKGAVYDSSLENILSQNGKTCDDSIIDKYKYQIYYSLNNDLRMVFLNNAYQPQYKKDKFQGTNSDDAYKYKFHYNKTSDCIVYYPTFKMYLPYDDWYKFQPEDNSFHWWWEKDTKDFTLISDWKYSNGTYTGTRVATNWEKLNQLGESADFTAISSFITDKDKLLKNGWKDGRPSDTNYPFCIEVDYNGKPGLFIYSNSKPKVSKVDIITNTHKQFNIYMVGMYGYVYNAINNCYINYDFTIKDGQKNFVQQYLFKYFSYELHCLDSNLNLTLYENYKGTDNDYKGTRVFFNWDITQDLKLSADDLQKLQNNCKEDIGAFTDSNGNHHGGNLNNYSDEDKNKFNESGSNSDSTTDNNFDFSFNGIMNYCDSFFSFIQSAFSVFPASIWLLISLSIAMLVFLRVLGR